MMLLDAIMLAAKTTGRDIYVPRQTLFASLYSSSDYKGISGMLACFTLGDCATPNVIIYQVHRLELVPIYP
jgi:hypothetical protein